MAESEGNDNLIDIMQTSIDISRHLYSSPEMSSEEFGSYAFITGKLKERGVELEEHFLGMKTAFVAKHGSGEPKICIFAEYDALPSGHACGHNIIAGWAVGTFLSISVDKRFNGTLYLVGSPAEEGRGEYASSKVKIAPVLSEMGIKAAFCIHPGDEWKVSGNYYARWRKSFEFTGRESHAAGAPEKGINALDAAVSFYTSYRGLRNQMRPDITVIISAIIKEGGVAVNVVPSKSTVWVDVRTDESDYLAVPISLIDNLAENIAKAHRCTLNSKELAPVTSAFRKNSELDRILYKAGKKLIVDLENPEENPEKPIGSSDVGDVSQVIPTSQLIVKIADKGTPLHSGLFLKAAGTEYAEESMIKAIRIAADAIIKYSELHQ